MFGGLFVASLICTGYQVIKEACEPTTSAENWANKDSYYRDLMSGVSVEQRMKNLKNGKYKLTETYPEPHRNSKTGKIIIENDKLYKEDVKKYGAYQARKWMYQGKYNLPPEKLKKQREEYDKEWEYLYSLLR